LLLTYRAARHWLELPWAAALVFLAAMASVERFLPRPEIVTYFGITAFWVLLQEGHERSWWGRTIFALVQVVWTSCHGLFVIGPFLVGCAWLESAVARAQGRPSELRSRSILLGIVLGASLVSPFGIDTWRYAFLMTTQVAGGWAPGVFAVIGELSPTFGPGALSGLAFWFFLVMLIGTVVIGAWASLRGFRSPARTLALIGLLVAALTGRRNIVLFVLVAAPFLAECLTFVLSPEMRRWSSSWAGGAATLMLACAWLPLSGHYYLSMQIPARFGWGVTPSFFPHGLPEFLDRIDFRGNVLNSNTIGGFYLYHGYPERRPLTDGCWVTIEPEQLGWLHSATADRLAWRRVVERYDIEALLLAHTSPEAGAILPEVAQDSRWQLVYYDAAASFWLAVGRDPMPPPVDLDDPTTLPALDRPEDGLMLSKFLHAVGAKRLLEPVLRQTNRFGLWQASLLEQLGMLEIEQARYAEAEGTFRRLLDLDGENTAALNELAFLAHQRGDLPEAMRFMQRAIRIDPTNESYRANYERLRAAPGGR
jgi:hypothetical protein